MQESPLAFPGRAGPPRLGVMTIFGLSLQMSCVYRVKLSHVYLGLSVPGSWAISWDRVCLLCFVEESKSITWGLAGVWTFINH